MLRFIAIVIASLGLGLLMALAASLRRPLARLVRALLVGITFVLMVAGVAIAAAGIAGEAWWAAIVGGGITLAALRLGWALRRRRPAPPAAAPDHVPLTRPPHDPNWQRFESGLDWVARKQARRSRAAIDLFVAERHSQSLTIEHRGLLVSCERRVPELLETCLERCRNANAHERNRYIDETLDTLIQIGNEADRARREVREADDKRLEVLHRYFDGVAGDSGRQPRLP